MAHYPYVNLAGSAGGCTTELTQIASGSTSFYAGYDVISSGIHVIGTDSGWDSSDLAVNMSVGTSLSVNYANCVIKSTVPLVPGDKIKICGIATGERSNPSYDGSKFSVLLQSVFCSEYISGNEEWPTNALLVEEYIFQDNHVCWSVTYTVPNKGGACDEGFILGFGCQDSNKQYKVTWTFDVEKPCVGPCDYEYTNIATHSLLFTQRNKVFPNDEFYGFSNTCGWRGPGDTSIPLYSGATIKVRDSFNGIKLPINLLPGDEIIVCGNANGNTSNHFSNGSQLSSRLSYFKCSEIHAAEGKTPTYSLIDPVFSFDANNICFSFSYVVAVPLVACDTMFLFGFGTEESRECKVTYSMFIRRKCGTCNVEYTPIAKTSGSWRQGKISGYPAYYIGNQKEGWKTCDLTVIQQINRQELSQPLNVDNTNCGIKLPFDLVQGDKITICGTVVCENPIDGEVFTAVLTQFLCSDYNAILQQWNVSPQLGITTTSFSQDVACWSLEYVVPAGGMLACDTNLILGMKSAIDTLVYQYTWTMDIVKMCPAPTEIGCCFTHATTVFVDPNGNDLTALEGKQTKPWKSIASAIEYLKDNGRTGYTVEVFPGEYLNEAAWVFVPANTNTTVKLNGNVKIISATGSFGGPKSFISATDSNFKIVGDDRVNKSSMTTPGAYIKLTNDMVSTLALAEGRCDISFMNVSMDTVSSKRVITFGSSTVNGSKLTLNNVSLSGEMAPNIHILECNRPPVIVIKNSDLYSGINIGATAFPNIRINYVYGSYSPATFIFIENSRLVINGIPNGESYSHIVTHTGNSAEYRGIMNSATFYWKTDSENVYIWGDNAVGAIVEVINPIVTNHDGWNGSFSFPTGFGIQLFKEIANPTEYDG